MKTKDLKTLDTAELTDKLNQSLTQLAVLRRKSVEGQLKDVREIREVRQTIARIKTIISASHA